MLLVAKPIDVKILSTSKMHPMKIPIDSKTKKMKGKFSKTINTKSETKLKNAILLGWFFINFDDHSVSSK